MGTGSTSRDRSHHSTLGRFVCLSVCLLFLPDFHFHVGFVFPCLSLFLPPLVCPGSIYPIGYDVSLMARRCHRLVPSKLPSLPPRIRSTHRGLGSELTGTRFRCRMVDRPSTATHALAVFPGRHSGFSPGPFLPFPGQSGGCPGGEIQSSVAPSPLSTLLVSQIENR